MFLAVTCGIGHSLLTCPKSPPSTWSFGIERCVSHSATLVLYSSSFDRKVDSWVQDANPRSGKFGTYTGFIRAK